MTRYFLAAILSLTSIPILANPASSVNTWNLPSLLAHSESRVEKLGSPQLGSFSDVKAISFDGAKDGLLFPTNPILGLNQFTIEAHIWPDASGQEEQRFFHVEDGEGRRALLETRVTDGTWALDTFLRTNSQQLALLDRSLRHPCGRWYWVALVYDGKEMKAYVDGKLELSGPVRFEPMTEGKTSVGVRQNLVYWFKGGISELRFHSRPLEPDQLSKAR